MSVQWSPGGGWFAHYGEKGRTHRGDRCTPTSWISNGVTVTCRPVAVIDPEDADIVEHLLGLVYESDHALTCGSGSCNRDTLAAALREFANPTPAIEEPQGLGAVVEDAEGARWIRADASRMPWVSRFGGNLNQQRWSGLNPVRVLSEGVTP